MVPSQELDNPQPVDDHVQIAHTMLFDFIIDLRPASPTPFNDTEVFRYPLEYSLNPNIWTFTKNNFLYPSEIAHLAHWRSGLKFAAEAAVYTWKWVLADEDARYWKFATAAFVFVGGQEYCLRTNVPVLFAGPDNTPCDPGWDEIRQALISKVPLPVRYSAIE